MTFIGILPDGEKIEKNTLDDLKVVAYVEYILKEEQTNNWPKYTLLNFDGTVRTLQKGNYEVIDLDFIDKKWCNGRVATIMERPTKKTQKVKFSKKWSDFLYSELIPILAEMDRFGDLELYNLVRECKNDENKNVIKCINRLLEIIEEKNATIERLMKNEEL